MLCVDNKYAAVILNNEYFTDLDVGQVMENLKVIKIYDDGKLGLTPEQTENLKWIQLNTRY